MEGCASEDLPLQKGGGGLKCFGHSDNRGSF